jgi:hypothetical protein
VSRLRHPTRYRPRPILEAYAWRQDALADTGFAIWLFWPEQPLPIMEFPRELLNAKRHVRGACDTLLQQAKLRWPHYPARHDQDMAKNPGFRPSDFLDHTIHFGLSNAK